MQRLPTSAVENTDIFSNLMGKEINYESISVSLRQEIKDILPVQSVFLVDGLPQDDLPAPWLMANLDKSSALGKQLMEDIRKRIARTLSTWKISALSYIDTWFDNERNSDKEADDEETSEDEVIEPDGHDLLKGLEQVVELFSDNEDHAAELISVRDFNRDFYPQETSTPIKNQGDEKDEAENPEHELEPATTTTPYMKTPKLHSNSKIREISSLSNFTDEEDEFKGKDENPKDNTNDSGLETSGYAISTQSKKSDCNLLNINSTSSNPNEEASRPEWRPLRPKWHCKEDPNYFHCHQDSPELCDNCSMQWGHPLYLGLVWDGEEWV